MTKDEAQAQLRSLEEAAVKQSNALVDQVAVAVHAEVLAYIQGLQPESTLFHPPMVLTPQQTADAITSGVLAALPGMASIVELSLTVGASLTIARQHLAKADEPC